MAPATEQRTPLRRHQVPTERGAGAGDAPRSDGPIAIRHLLPKQCVTVRRIPVFVVGRGRRRLRWIEIVKRELEPAAWEDVDPTRNQPSEEHHDC